MIIDEGAQFDLGGAVLTAYSFPGHMMAELGWFEHSTKTLLLADAITGLDWELVHGHLTVSGYRNTLNKLENLLTELDVQNILMAHYVPQTPDSLRELIAKAHDYINCIERTVITVATEQDTVTVQHLWEQFLERHNKLREFRSLSTVFAHCKDLVERGVFEVVEPNTYKLI